MIDNLYATDDIALASWLMIQGHKIVDMDRGGAIVEWQFRQSNELNDDLYVYSEAKEPMGNVRMYEEARKLLYSSLRRPEVLTVRGLTGN